MEAVVSAREQRGQDEAEEKAGRHTGNLLGWG